RSEEAMRTPTRTPPPSHLSGPTGSWGRGKVKGTGSVAKAPIAHSVEGIEFREQRAPPQNSAEGGKQRCGLQQDSCQDPQKDDPRLEVKRLVLPGTTRRSQFVKPLL